MENSKLNAGSPVEFFLAGPPVPAPRPRFRVINTKAGGQFVSVYYDAKYQAFLKSAPKAMPQLATPLTGALALDVHFYIARPKTTKRETPRFDIDNYLKAIMDAMTHAGIWIDDDQVSHCVAVKSWAGDEEAGLGMAGTFVSVTSYGC